MNYPPYINNTYIYLDTPDTDTKMTDERLGKKQLQDIVDRLRDLPTTSQDNSVMVPGDPEKKCYDIRIKEGIPIDEIKYEEFLAISSMFKEVIE